MYNPGVQYDPSPIERGLSKGALELAQAFGDAQKTKQENEYFTQKGHDIVETIGPDKKPLWSMDKYNKFMSSGLSAKKAMVADTIFDFENRWRQIESNNKQTAQKDASDLGWYEAEGAQNHNVTMEDIRRVEAQGTRAHQVTMEDIARLEAQGKNKPLGSPASRPVPGVKGREVQLSDGSVKLVMDPLPAGPATPTEANVTFASNIDIGLQKLDALEKIVKEHGNAQAGWFKTPEVAAKLGSLPYDLAVLSAKVVDPATAAREGEVESAKKYQIPLGWGTRSEVTLEGIKERRKTFLQYKAARAKAQQAPSLIPGVSDSSEEGAADPVALSAMEPTLAPVDARTLATRALNDPSSSPAHKATARKILGLK